MPAAEILWFYRGGAWPGINRYFCTVKSILRIMESLFGNTLIISYMHIILYNLKDFFNTEKIPGKRFQCSCGSFCDGLLAVQPGHLRRNPRKTAREFVRVRIVTTFRYSTRPLEGRVHVRCARRFQCAYAPPNSVQLGFFEEKTLLRIVAKNASNFVLV